MAPSEATATAVKSLTGSGSGFGDELSNTAWGTLGSLTSKNVRSFCGYGLIRTETWPNAGKNVQAMMRRVRLVRSKLSRHHPPWISLNGQDLLSPVYQDAPQFHLGARSAGFDWNRELKLHGAIGFDVDRDVRG
jgi:hypothetical protein